MNKPEKLMAKIHIEIPETFPFSTELDIYIEHINSGRHLANGVIDGRDWLFAARRKGNGGGGDSGGHALGAVSISGSAPTCAR